jgi:zinc/manganese transport system permease protein
MAVGIMLLPAITARFWVEDVSKLIIVSVVAAFVAGAFGLLLSYYENLPTGPAIILTSGILYVLSLLFGPRGSIVRQLLPRKHLEA